MLKQIEGGMFKRRQCRIGRLTFVVNPHQYAWHIWVSLLLSYISSEFDSFGNFLQQFIEAEHDLVIGLTQFTSDLNRNQKAPLEHLRNIFLSS